jgi:hypothetical protein
MASDAPSSSRMPVASVLFAGDFPAVAPVREVAPYPGAPNFEKRNPEAEYEFQRELREREQLSGLGQTAQGYERWGGGQASGLPDTPTQMAEELRQQVEARAACGGLPDEPDDGGARGVTSKPYRF